MPNIRGIELVSRVPSIQPGRATGTRAQGNNPEVLALHALESNPSLPRVAEDSQQANDRENATGTAQVPVTFKSDTSWTPKALFYVQKNPIKRLLFSNAKIIENTT